MALLEGRRLLITGVLTEGSIAFAVARRAQEEGAQIVLTRFGRGIRITTRIANRLPDPPDVLELDVNDPDHIAAVVKDIEERWGALDGILHAIAFAPADALGGAFLATPPERASTAFLTSAYSLKGLVAPFVELLEKGEHGSIVGLDFDAALARPARHRVGGGRAGPGALRPTLAPAGPIKTIASGSIPGFELLAGAWDAQAPLAWDPKDAGPVADACLFLLSGLARGVTGEIVHVDGGYHALGAP